MEEQSKALEDVQNEFVESRREQTRLQEELLRKEKALRDTKIRSKHEMGGVLDAKIREYHETIQQRIPIAANARTDEFQ